MPHSSGPCGPLPKVAVAERLMDLVCAAEMRVQNWTGVVYAMGLGFTPELATAVFRSWNIPGEPIPASEIEALIRGADLGWSP